MRTLFVYMLLIGMLLFSCKHDTSKCPKCPECAKFHADAHVVKTPKTTKTSTFLALSDVHIDRELRQTCFETEGMSDKSVTSDTLWKRTKFKIESVAKSENPKFMVYLGDLPGYKNSERRNNSHLMLQNLRKLKVNVPILYLPGNNDSLEGDYYSFSNDSLNTVLKEDADAGNPWPIINSKSTTVQVKNLDDSKKQFGYYSVDLVDGKNTLKVIALNTVIFCAKGKHQYVAKDGVSQQKATQEQMTWLEAKLTSLGMNDRVLIMMHIPIGKDGYNGKQMWQNDLEFIDKSGNKHTLYNGFLDLIAAHKTNIVGLLNGHTHTDGLRRLYASDSKSMMTSFSVSTPGIAVNHGNNPSFKIFTYNTNTFDLLDFKTYYASPTVKKKYKYSTDSKNTDFKFLDGSSYTFRDSYYVHNPNQTIFNTLEKQPYDSLVKYVNSTLGAKSNRHSKLKHPDAVNVYKE
ncbi:calcineurin-like phosphoesterase family protein [Kordia periserrulae]|uniref:Calcineurin-like phosphoesterase family protein n=1 Tax=Kordia periserrulae TaxID=701523 RepID=A0A2T6C1D3_9FLAO|nr:metallophosphoesterase [Kordia periserrulae]PTX62132.1 calcineurin-like phosphoesterase family protein [Kordia periserrulae]